ncbi:MAG: class I SAM-dependent methyltransferase [Anaerolineae bacterium]|nr:class I SAM-dependent methyltransferase [Anaerolineae bacterium]
MFARVVECGQDGALVGTETAARYAEMADGLMIQYRGFLSHLKTLDVGNRYLEIGPGPGVLTTAVAREKPDAHITGIEMSPDMVSVAGEYIERAGMTDRIRFLVGDAGNSDDFASLEQFDLIYSTFSLHHWEDPKQVIQNLMSVLADGGLIYIHDLRRAWWLYWVPSSGGFWKSIRAAYVSRELREMLHSLGIERYEIRSVFPFMHSILIWK